jgi:hypothetical protein
MMGEQEKSFPQEKKSCTKRHRGECRYDTKRTKTKKPQRRNFGTKFKEKGDITTTEDSKNPIFEERNRKDFGATGSLRR